MSNLNEEDIAKYQEKQENQDSSLGDFIMNNLAEWSKLITELSEKEIQLLNLKNKIFEKEQLIINETDFKGVYGKNNSDIRKTHLNSLMKNDYETRQNLELSIDYIKRRIIFLKQLIHTKTIIMEVKE